MSPRDFDVLVNDIRPGGDVPGIVQQTYFEFWQLTSSRKGGRKMPSQSPGALGRTLADDYICMVTSE
jgi:hypothetical protein